MRKVYWITAIVSLLLGGILLWPEETRKAPEAVAAERAVAAEGRVTVRPDRRAVLAAELPGRITEIRVDNLAPVKAGQVLAVLSNGDLEERIRQTEASLKKMEAQVRELENGSRTEDLREGEALVRKAEADLVLAQRNEERDRRLAEEGVIAQSRFDESVAALQRSESELRAAQERYERLRRGPRVETLQAARAEMMSEKYALESLRATLEKTYIRSPLDGIVIQRYRNSSEFADSGDPIVEVANLSEIIVEAEVNETDASRVHTRQKAYVTSDAYPDRKFAAEIYEVSAALRKRSSEPDDPAVVVDQKVLPVKVRFLEPLPLKLGMKVDVKFLEESGSKR